MKEALSWLVLLVFMLGFLHFLFSDVLFIIRHPRRAWHNLPFSNTGKSSE